MSRLWLECAGWCSRCGSHAAVQREAEVFALPSTSFLYMPRVDDQPALPPQRSSERDAPRISALSNPATECLEQAFGKADKVVFASPDTGQQGGVAHVAASERSSTVGEGGESTLAGHHHENFSILWIMSAHGLRGCACFFFNCACAN